MKTLLLAALLAAPVAAPAAAQGTGHAAHGTHGAASADASPSTSAFEAAAARMHEAMGADLTGDADVDFVRGMIPHHQGAVDMARIVLEYGKDPELRALAEEIVETQEAEIAVMEAWLERNAPEAGAPAQ